MEDNIENQQPITNPVEEIKFTHEGSIQIGCSTGIHELEITKLNPGENGLTEVLMMCRRCGQNFTSQERLNINDILGGTNEPVSAVPQQIAQPIAQPLPQKPQSAPQQATPVHPVDAYKDSDSFWEEIKKNSK